MRIFFLLMLLAFAGFSKKVSGQTDYEIQQRIKQAEKYERVFSSLDSLLKIDNGRFWNYKLQGPMLLINPKTREFFANQNNAKNEFQKFGNVYYGILPEEINIANTAKDWNGKRWTMVMIPLPSNQLDLFNLLVHESFHRIQPYIGFDKLKGSNNGHLEKFKGRFLLRLELQALYECLDASNPEEKTKHLKSALIFRNERQKDETHKTHENLLELNEGLAEYTGMMLSGMNDEQKEESLKSKLTRFMSKKSFTRSFAYHTIPAYGYLAAKIQLNWHQKITIDTQLTESLLHVFAINPQIDYKSLFQDNRYNYTVILNEEQKREELIVSRIRDYEKRFQGANTFKLFFKKMSIGFNPNNIFHIDTMGTVYSGLRVSDQWGILEVEKDALIDPKWSHVTITKPLKFEKEIVLGKGWKLTLNEGWKVEQKENFYTVSQK